MTTSPSRARAEHDPASLQPPATGAGVTADWHPQPAAERQLMAFLIAGLSVNAGARALAERLLGQVAVRLRDIVDTIVVADHDTQQRFRQAGWSQPVVEDMGSVWANPAGLFPTLREGAEAQIWLRVEDIDTFLSAHGLETQVAGEAYAPLRLAMVYPDPGCAVGIVERNGGTGLNVGPDHAAERRLARLHLNAFRARRRQFDTVEQGLDHTQALVRAAIADLGPHRACDAWLKAERAYWMRRCAAGRLQKARQDAAGIGWANIDHHTYDGSRRHFRQTIEILEMLGYRRREMLYAGELAGWGSQVLEQPVIGSTIFADIDLAPEELTIDFATVPLEDLPRHRRAGLLSALLGESILEAGLNHVAGLYDQRALRAQLAAQQVGMMAPFTDFPHLYQELTLGDWDAVEPARIDALEAAGHIGTEEAERLRLQGSIVTHLENIERNDGYKGFNRAGIDGVLRKLDPRAYHGAQSHAQTQTQAPA